MGRASGARLWIGAGLAAALWTACASEPPHATTVLAKVPERIVILPLNVPVAMPAELEPSSPAVWSALESYLRAQGSSLKTVSFPSARGLWLTSIRDAQAAAEGLDAGEEAGFR